MMCQSIRLACGLLAAALLPGLASPLAAAEKSNSIQIVNSYADLADLALSAPVVASATVKKATRLKEKDSLGIPVGNARFLITATVENLIVGNRAMPSEISYLIDVPLDSRGKPPRITASRVFLFLDSSPGRPDFFSLSDKYGQIAWTPETDQMIRSILGEANTPAGRMRITGIGSAFNVPGAIPGESETQIFLATADQRPVSLSVLRRPGEQPQWGVSLGEIVDESSRPAGRNTVLWYRLTCSLPAAMPESSIAGASPEARNAILTDYGFVLSQLGPCDRRLNRN